jgi:hypothetical protein
MGSHAAKRHSGGLPEPHSQGSEMSEGKGHPKGGNPAPSSCLNCVKLLRQFPARACFHNPVLSRQCVIGCLHRAFVPRRIDLLSPVAAKLVPCLICAGAVVNCFGSPASLGKCFRTGLPRRCPTLDVAAPSRGLSSSPSVRHACEILLPIHIRVLHRSSWHMVVTLLP